jgi:tetratricopeptide (TPR) repeat protein
MRKLFITILLGVWMPALVSSQMVNELRTTAMECYELKDYACAEIYLRDLVRLEKDADKLAGYCLMLGSILSESEDVKEAFKYFKIAIKNNPELVEAWVKRGILYSNEGNTKKALADFEKALEIEPDNELALSQRAEILSENGN